MTTEYERGVRDALQRIADLPTGRSEDVMEGQEQAYRSVEALFDAPAGVTVQEPDPAPMTPVIQRGMHE